jgi:integrase
MSRRRRQQQPPDRDQQTPDAESGALMLRELGALREQFASLVRHVRDNKRKARQRVRTVRERSAARASRPTKVDLAHTRKPPCGGRRNLDSSSSSSSSSNNYGDGYTRTLPSGRTQALFPNGKGEHKSLGTYGSVEEAEQALVNERIRGSDPARLGTETLLEYGERVILRWGAQAKREGRDVRGKETRNKLSRWKCWVGEHLPAAKNPVACLDDTDVEEFGQTLLECESAREELVANLTIKRIITLLKQVCAQALKDRVIDRNPCAGYKIPQRKGDPRKQPNPLTTHELALLLACETYTAGQRAALSLVPFTGLRQGELAALEWSDVHNLFDDQPACNCKLTRGLPHLHISKSWEDPCPKNGLTRTVWLIEPAQEILKSWHRHADRIRSKFVWGTLYARGYDWGWAPKRDHFHGICYLGARREAGILRRVTFHHLRDTYASHLISGTFGRRWSADEVAKQLGHSSTYVTERYATVLDEALEAAAAETRGYELPESWIQTPHEHRTAELALDPQLLEITLHAQRDSNSRHSVPKTDALSS